MGSSSSPQKHDQDNPLSPALTSNVSVNDLQTNALPVPDTSQAGDKALVMADAIAAPLSNAGLPVVAGRVSDIWRLFTLNNKVLLGNVIVVLFVLIAAFGPLFVHVDPNAFSYEILQPPSAAHWLGTTQTGQDVFAQLMVGTRSSIFWGFVTGLIVTALSVIVGLVGGYIGGIVDEFLSLVSNVFLILPALPLAIVLAAYFPFKGPLTIALVIVITSWSWQARVLRAQTLSMRNRDFIEAARASGESTWRIIFYEILPNEIAIVVAGFISTVLYVILAAAGLEFLGVGDTKIVSWGSMFFWAQSDGALVLGAWWWFLPPGIGIALLGMALALINFGIDEIANPRLSHRLLVTRRPKKVLDKRDR